MIRPILITLLLLIPALPGHATQLNKDQANAYYKNCVAQSDPRLSQKSQEALCSCTSAMMTQQMSVEDIQTMGQNTQAGRDALNKMLLDVYAPCMQFPVEDLVATECLKDEKISMMGLKSDRRALCGCIAARTGAWLKSTGRSIMSGLIGRNANITDPISPVMDSPEFRSASYDNLVSCMGDVQ